MKDLKDRVVLITGASHGIGREMALLFAAEGARLALLDIDEGGLRESAAMAGEDAAAVETFTCDIADRAAVAGTIERVRKTFGMVDVLINNAGIVTGRDFGELSLDDIARTMDINFWGHLYFTKEILPEMIQKGEGVIVNVASACGLLGMSGLTDYSASKFAEVGFTESLRREVRGRGHRGITITCVCPYVIDTGMFEGFKPMLFSPFVKKKRAARRIVTAVKKGRPYVTLPAFHVRAMMVLKLLPTALFDWLLRIWGGDRAMRAFHSK